jgi:hypothetical protein
LNPSCLSSQSGIVFYIHNYYLYVYQQGNGTSLIFGNLTASPNSSVTILSGSLQSNQTYQFMVYMQNRKNSSIQATGYVLIIVEDTRPQLIAVG